MAFTDSCEVEVLSGQISGTLTDFVFTVVAQDNSLKLIANGGVVTQKEEIRVFSDAGLTAAISFYRLFYDGTTGLFIADAKVASAAVGSKVYLGFGDAALTSEASSTSTYPTDLSTVLPMTDGSTLSVADISQAGNHGTNNGATAGSGAIGSGAASFDGTNDYIALPDQYAGNLLTLSCVLNTSVNSAIKAIFAKRNLMTGEGNSGAECWALYLTAAGKVRIAINSTISGSGGFSIDLTGATTLSTGVSYVVHATWDGTNATIYLDGVQDATAGTTGSSVYNGTEPIHIGDDGDGSRFFSGTIQFARISGSGRTSAWAAAESRMWKTPASFASYTFGAPSGGGPVVPVFMSSYRRRFA